MNKKTRQYVNDLLNKYFKWAVLLVVILMFLMGYFWVLQPKYEDTMDSIKTHLRLKRQSYLTKKEQLAKIEKLASTYKNMDQEKIDKVNTFLPTGRNYERLFTEMDALVSRNGLILSQMNMNVEGESNEKEGRQQNENEQEEDSIQRSTPSKVRAVKIKMKLAGVDYPGLKSFISSLENNLRLMDVTSINFSPDKGTAQLRVRTYYFNKKDFDVTRDINL